MTSTPFLISVFLKILQSIWDQQALNPVCLCLDPDSPSWHSSNAGQITKAHMLHFLVGKVLIPRIPAFACEQMTCSNRRVLGFSPPLLGYFTLKWHAWSYMSRAKYGWLLLLFLYEPFFHSEDMQVIIRVETETRAILSSTDGYSVCNISLVDNGNNNTNVIVNNDSNDNSIMWIP